MSVAYKKNGTEIPITSAIIGGGGGNANIWHGTHAEYEVEKDAIEDGTQVCFTDDIGITAGAEYYSDVEQVIGTYMGKPLYRKVFTYTGSSSISATGDTWINLGFDFTNCYAIRGYMILASSAGDADVHMSYPIIIDNTSPLKIMHTRNVTTNIYTNSRFVIEYTKSTDSEIGVINGLRCGDVYSETEQVIGTWIDGKPLYRKVIDYGYGPSQTGSYVYKAHGINNIDAITKVNGTIKFASGQVSALPFASTSALNSQVSIAVDTTNVGIMVGFSRTTDTFIFIIEYTKTTD